ncbi:MAG: single-stranded-DNA-specific exonuclease RecJ, partial [Candidatus Buchananbacteria bacterium]|nr:single-stranded-DNA-specific exonuclease RecJ [Candidatus Buchananbacteria bacterium]
MEKKWQILPAAPETLRQQFPEYKPVILQLLYNRGLTEQVAIDKFLNPSYEHDILDPYLFVDMHKAVERLVYSIIHNEPVMVYGDYDADGVCSS